MSDQELIDEYFNDPLVKIKLNDELGKNGTVKVDWVNRTVSAIGNKATKKWNLDEMLYDLKKIGVK